MGEMDLQLPASLNLIRAGLFSEATKNEWWQMAERRGPPTRWKNRWQPVCGTCRGWWSTCACQDTAEAGSPSRSRGVRNPTVPAPSHAVGEGQCNAAADGDARVVSEGAWLRTGACPMTARVRVRKERVRGVRRRWWREIPAG